MKLGLVAPWAQQVTPRAHCSLARSKKERRGTAQFLLLENQPPAGKPTSCLAAAAISVQPQHGLSRSEPGNASPVPISTRKLGWSVSQPPFLTPKSLGHARQPELFGTAGVTSLVNPALPFCRFPRREPGQPPACQ